MHRPLTALFCAGALAFAGGCGESDQEQAREVVEDYVEARAEGDFERVCELFADELKEELGVGEDCAGFVEEQTSGGDGREELQIIDVRVSDDRSVAEIDVVREPEGPSRIGLLLERRDGDWRIVGLQ